MASEKADAWMPLYVTDYLGDTMHLTTEQHGAYMLLLMACWKGDGRIPNEDGRLAAITKLPMKRWKLHRLTLLKFFTLADSYITHKRVLKEREKAKEISAERRESGKKGAAKRWQTDGNCHSSAIANASQTAWQNDAPSPSQLPEAKSNNPSGCSSPKGGAPGCPHAEIVALYHELLPANPRIKEWEGSRQANLRARWRQDPRRQSLDYWRRFFTHVAASEFLTGRTTDREGRPFLPGLDWLVMPKNFAKVIEGRYHDRSAT